MDLGLCCGLCLSCVVGAYFRLKQNENLESGNGGEIVYMQTNKCVSPLHD